MKIFDLKASWKTTLCSRCMEQLDTLSKGLKPNLKTTKLHQIENPLLTTYFWKKRPRNQHQQEIISFQTVNDSYKAVKLATSQNWKKRFEKIKLFQIYATVYQKSHMYMWLWLKKHAFTWFPLELATCLCNYVQRKMCIGKKIRKNKKYMPDLKDHTDCPNYNTINKTGKIKKQEKRA